jgi:hypothetical protein
VSASDRKWRHFAEIAFPVSVEFDADAFVADILLSQIVSDR